MHQPSQLTDELRPNLRKREKWMTCFQSWLSSEKPSLLRDWMKGPREELLRHLDSKAWMFMEMTSQGVEAIDALEILFPEWEESATSEEIDQEDSNQLTQEEEVRLMQVRPA